MDMPESPEILIEKAAHEVGFSLVGVTDLSSHPESDKIFEKWLREGKHGEMLSLLKSKDTREVPARLLEGAKSAICVAVNYYTEALHANEKIDGRDGKGIFSIYAHGRDYHAVLGEMLDELAGMLKCFFPEMRYVACVDTMPVSDRTFAIRSGIGWLGKNTNVISPKYGSWIFLGELITTLELKASAPLQSLCGDCNLCIDACPTGALEEGFILDARKCISYLTIEKRGEIPQGYHKSIGLRVCGCDECQRVCPYNAVATESTVFRQKERHPLVDMKLTDLARIEDDRFRELTKDSPIGRCKAAGIRRNARIAMNNISSR